MQFSCWIYCYCEIIFYLLNDKKKIMVYKLLFNRHILVKEIYFEAPIATEAKIAELSSGTTLCLLYRYIPVFSLSSDKFHYYFNLIFHKGLSNM